LTVQEKDMTSSRTLRLTTAQALVRYLSRQYSVADGERRRLIPAAMGIFGHGNVAGVGQALQQYSDDLPYYLARNEQAMVHAASAFARQKNRLQSLDGLRTLEVVLAAYRSAADHEPKPVERTGSRNASSLNPRRSG
jgi:hypothetical protein